MTQRFQDGEGKTYEYLLEWPGAGGPMRPDPTISISCHSLWVGEHEARRPISDADDAASACWRCA